MVAARSNDRTLAFKFSHAIEIAGGRPSVFTPRQITTTVKDVISRIVHDQGIQFRGLFGNDLEGVPIDTHGAGPISLSLIDSRVGRGIDNHVRADGADGGTYAIQISEITAIGGVMAIKRDHFAKRSQGALELPADLAIFAKK